MWKLKNICKIYVCKVIKAGSYDQIMFFVNTQFNNFSVMQLFLFFYYIFNCLMKHGVIIAILLIGVARSRSG